MAYLRQILDLINNRYRLSIVRINNLIWQETSSFLIENKNNRMRTPKRMLKIVLVLN